MATISGACPGPESATSGSGMAKAASRPTRPSVPPSGEPWEKFRLPGDGEAGDAVSTWEPASGLTKTDAYKAWEEQQ